LDITGLLKTRQEKKKEANEPTPFHRTGERRRKEDKPVPGNEHLYHRLKGGKTCRRREKPEDQNTTPEKKKGGGRKGESASMKGKNTSSRDCTFLILERPVRLREKRKRGVLGMPVYGPMGKKRDSKMDESENGSV